MRRAMSALSIPSNNQGQSTYSRSILTSDVDNSEFVVLWRHLVKDPGHERLQLGPRQKLPEHVVSTRGVLMLAEGGIAIESATGMGKRQVLDFLMPDDAVLCIYLSNHKSLSFRAITQSLLIYPNLSALKQLETSHEYWIFAFEHSQRQLTRAYIKQIMIGCMDAEARVASFLLFLALRSGVQSNGLVSAPMSREDIADYLAINRDTISRIMMKFETINVIKRNSRHKIRVVDMTKLRSLTPIAELLSKTIEKYNSRCANIHTLALHDAFE